MAREVDAVRAVLDDRRLAGDPVARAEFETQTAGEPPAPATAPVAAALRRNVRLSNCVRLRILVIGPGDERGFWYTRRIGGAPVERRRRGGALTTVGGRLGTTDARAALAAAATTLIVTAGVVVVTAGPTVGPVSSASLSPPRCS
ncbi:hypothetical protein ACFQFH_05240 [Halobaculum halobium]|uniref:hypothetical protein n=1 Tax=Halobaculum halobium TaxID=3032281 RepID=UPI00360647D5